MRMSLPFVVILQLMQAIHGYSWWLLFGGLGVWSLMLPVSTTYGGAALVMMDDYQGIQYTSDWARIFTAAFLSLFFTLILVAIGGVVVLALGMYGVFF